MADGEILNRKVVGVGAKDAALSEAGDRHFQYGLERRRHRRPAGRSLDLPHVGLAMGLLRHGRDCAAIPWLSLLPNRQTWAFVLAKFLTDSIWRWYLYLLPLFFSSHF